MGPYLTNGPVQWVLLEICWNKTQKESIDILLGQWLNFKLFGITYLVGKISRSNFFFSVHWLSEIFFIETQLGFRASQSSFQSPCHLCEAFPFYCDSLAIDLYTSFHLRAARAQCLCDFWGWRVRVYTFMINI